MTKLLWGGDGSPRMRGQEIYVDERSLMLVVTDSEKNIQKVEGLLKDLQETEPAGLVWRSYTIQEGKGPQIKALLEALLRSHSAEPFQPERKLIVEGSELILKDTPENIKKAEEILQNGEFLEKIYSKTLGVETFNLSPIAALEANPDLVSEFSEFVVEVVETLLYSQDGRQKARAEGRRLWFDPATMQLTVTDYPENLKAVSNFVDALPQIRKKKRSKIIFLEHATAADLTQQIEEFLGFEGGESGDRGGLEVTKTLRTGSGSGNDFKWRELSVRLTRVNDNDLNDDSDDDVEMIVRTPGNSQTVTMQVFHSEFVGDYEITVDDVKPSNTPGEGRAKLRIRYQPAETAEGEEEEETPDPEEERAAETGTEEEPELSIVEIENLNAVFIEYGDPARLNELLSWIEILDIPTLQVSLEVKFVEVIEDRARELSSEIDISNLADLSDLGSNNIVSARAFDDLDEFRSGFEPLIETPRSANLGKGTTFLNWITGGSSRVSVQLRALESQGIINIVNGPHVTVLNGESADFEIERQFGIPTPLEGSTTDEDEFQAVPSLRTVQMTLEPTITRKGNITLDIDGEIQDFDQNLAALSVLEPPDTELVSGQPGSRVAVVQSGDPLGVLRKVLTTKVRIKDGGTVVLGGWTNQRDQNIEGNVPVLGDIPFIGKLFFSRNLSTSNKITLLIFLTGNIVD